tara:strand:- start:487 stop:2208 length:1722 start_codon:yes stop_codon:yes gene_type:complete
MAEETWRILISEDAVGGGDGGDVGSAQAEDSSIPPQQKLFFEEMKEHLKKWSPFLVPGGMLYGIYQASTIAKETTRGLFQIVQAMMDLIFLPLMPIFSAIFKAISPLVPQIGRLAEAFMEPIVDWLLPKVEDILDQLEGIDWEEQMAKWREYGVKVAGWLEVISKAIGEFTGKLGTIWGDEETTLAEKLVATGTLFWETIEPTVTEVFTNAAATLYEVLSPIGAFLISHLKLLWYEFVKIDLNLMFQEIFAGLLRFIGMEGKADKLETRMEREREIARGDIEHQRGQIEIPEILKPFFEAFQTLTGANEIVDLGEDSKYKDNWARLPDYPKDNYLQIPDYTQEEKYLMEEGAGGRSNALRMFLEGTKLKGIGKFGDEEMQEQYQILKDLLGTTTEGLYVVEEMIRNVKDRSGEDFTIDEYNQLRAGAGIEKYTDDQRLGQIIGAIGLGAAGSMVGTWGAAAGVAIGAMLGGWMDKQASWWWQRQFGGDTLFPENKSTSDAVSSPNLTNPTINIDINSEIYGPQGMDSDFAEHLAKEVAGKVKDVTEDAYRGAGDGLSNITYDFNWNYSGDPRF